VTSQQLNAATAGLASASSVNSAISSATAPLATKSEVTAATAGLDTVTARQSAVSALAATVPTASTTTPPGVADSSITGTMTGVYALANHTHASKARKGRVLVPTAGFLDVTFSSAFTSGVIPLCAVTAETSTGDTSVVNAQMDGAPSATGMRIRITRTSITAVSLLGLSVLSVPTQVATYAHYVCLEP
jgi:hypothetical protein